MQAYLCRALGEFHVEEPWDALREAAAGQRPDDVRRSAIEAMAVLASNVGVQDPRSHKPIMSTLLEASDDHNASIRATTAFTLGVIGGPQAEARLEALLGDADVDVRFNAACGLARWGKDRARNNCRSYARQSVGGRRQPRSGDRSYHDKCDTYFLPDPNATAVGVLLEMLQPGQGVTVQVNALEAIRQAAVRALTNADMDQAVRGKAAAVLDELERRDL